MADTLAGSFNERQIFNERGIAFQVVTLTGGGWCVVRMEESKLPNVIVASEPTDDEAEAVATAERLRKEALN